MLAKPLYDIIKKNTTFRFSVAENYAFEKLKRHLSSRAALAIYSPLAETELHCDASASGFGGMVSCFRSKMMDVASDFVLEPMDDAYRSKVS